MKRLKIFKAYFVLWLFVYFIAISNLETFKLYFLSTLTFNIAIVALLAIGTFMIFKAAKDLTMVTGTFGVLMYKKGDLSFYLKGVEKIFPSTIANKIKTRAESGLLLFTQQESEDILSWLEEKYSNQNKYNNFFIGTVLMIGLLGTFSGLLGSIASMGAIVSSLAGSNVDIGKIMADFSIPLSSMAVGFGSSLFGVISAILLSIKGYLLNKAQESLLSGVENWLQEKIVESATESVEPSTTLDGRQKSYMDIFVEQIATLSNEMREVSIVNREFQSTFIETMKELRVSSQQEQEFLYQIKNSLKDISKNSMQTTSYIANNQLQLQELLQMQKSQNNHVNYFISESKYSREIIEKREEIITDMLIRQDKKEQESKINIFQMADAIDSLDKNIKKRLSKLETLIEKRVHKESTHSKFEDGIDFMKQHFLKEEKN